MSVRFHSEKALARWGVVATWKIKKKLLKERIIALSPDPKLQ